MDATSIFWISVEFMITKKLNIDRVKFVELQQLVTMIA